MPLVHVRVTAIGNTHQTDEDWTRNSGDILADRQTRTHRQTKQTNRHTSQYFTSLLGGGGVVTQMASDRCTLHKRLKKVLEKLQVAFWRPGLRLICYHRMKVLAYLKREEGSRPV